MLLSIVIPAFNEEKLLAEHLQLITVAMRESNFEAQSWEVIVCDNNSTDGTAEIAKSEGAIVVFEACNQISLARNRGAEAASGLWLLFVDADSYPDATVMNDVLEVIDSDEFIAAGFPGSFFGKVNLWQKIVLRHANNVMRRLQRSAGAFFLCHAGHFHALGGFNSEIYAAEDMELSARLKKRAASKGLRFTYRENVVFYTSPRKFNMYSTREMLLFFWHAATMGKSVFLDKSKLALWYDGRR